MSVYQINLGRLHRDSLLGLINHDNAATIITPLTTAEVELSANTKLEDGNYTALVTNKAYTSDTVTVTYTKLSLGDFVTMTVDGGDFDWYAPDDWNDATSVPAALASFKAAALRDGVNPDAAFDSITITRRFDEVSNHFMLIVTVSSYVWKEVVEFQMPKHFSEVIDVTDMNGFTFTPIALESVIG